MEIQVQELEYCKLHVTCVSDEKEIQSKKNEVLKIFKKAPVPGFRKGKASVNIIKNYYKNQIEDSLKKALAEESLHQSMFEKQYKPIGGPQFTQMWLQPSKFSCQFVIHKKPDFDLKDYKSIEIPMPAKPLDSDDYAQKLMQDLRVKHGSRVPFSQDNFVETGDLASVTYDAYIDSQKRDDLSVTDPEVITVGASRVSEFDTNILGMKVGETREFEVLVSNSSRPDLEGKTIKFVLTLNSGIKIVPCGLDDDFAKQVGKDNFEQLKNEVNQAAFSASENQFRNAKLNVVIANLVSLHDFVVPEWLSVQEAKHMAATAKQNWDSFTDQTKENYVAQANKNVKLSLILEKIRENEPEAQLADTELIEIVKQNVSKMVTESIEKTLNDLNNLGYLQVLYNRIRDEYTLDYLLKTIKFKE